MRHYGPFWPLYGAMGDARQFGPVRWLCRPVPAIFHIYGDGVNETVYLAWRRVMVLWHRKGSGQ